MTTIQKVVKYLAAAFAIFLSVSIIGGICGALATATFIFGGNSVVGDMQNYPVTDAGIKSISINISAAKLNVRTGESFSIESNHKRLDVKVSNGCLEISEKDKFIGLKTADIEINVYIPQNFVFENARIETGAGKVTVDALAANNLSLELGAGEAVIQSLSADRKAEINGGAGKLTINSGKLYNLEADMGVGEFDMTAALEGSSKIDHGVGAVKLNLAGSADDYTIELDKGLGKVTVGGQELSDGAVFGTGINKLELDGGVGEIKVDFAA